MGSLPLALSIHHFINSVGADAGFASIIGLAILILLYFAQARETATLRTRAQEAAERIQHLEARLAQALRAQATPAPAGQPAQATPAPAGQPAQATPAGQPAQAGQTGAPRPQPAAQPSPAPAAARAPLFRGAPAGVAAPALTAATKLIPTPLSAPEPAGALAVTDRRPAAPAAVPVAAAVAPSGAAVATPPPPTSPAPATVAGGANGAPGATRTPPPVQPRPAATLPPARRPAIGRPPASTRPSRSRRALAFMVTVLVLAGVVVALLAITSAGSNSSSSKSTAASNARGRHHAAVGTGVKPSTVTVAVLNGTATNGLAHRMALKLAGMGYKEGTVETAPDQTHTSTVVAYLPGFKRDATAVAASLKLSAGVVQQVDPSTQAVACPPPAACTANVVVTVGADLAGTV